MAVASWGDLSVGRGGSDNVLEIFDGALVANHHGIVGEMSNAWNNSVSVTGTNSEWRNLGDLYMGGRMSHYFYMTSDGWENEWVNGGQGNSLYVGDGGLVTVGNDMHNRNHSLVNIESGGHISVASNYYQDATSVLRFGVETNAVGEPLNPFVHVGGTAEFEEGATLQYHSNVGVLDFDTFYTNLIVEADQLIVAGVTNAQALDLETINLDGSLVEVILWENDQDIYGLVGRRYLAESASFESNSMMGMLAKEFDDMSLLGDPKANSMINLLNTMSGSQQSAQLNQQYGQGAPTYQHGRSMTEGMSEIKKHAVLKNNRSKQGEPAGASGPYGAEQDLQGWIKPYGLWTENDAQDGFAGYDQNVYGTVVGFDLPLEGALLGVAGGYGYSSLNFDNGDESTAQTGYGVVYLSSGTEDWFYNVNMGFGKSKIEQASGSAFENSADFDASNFALQIGGGKEVVINRSWSVTPKASALWAYYYQQAYTETSQYVERNVNAYERNSLLSTLGTAVNWQKQFKSMALKPEARLYWLHQFNDDIDQIDYELVNGMGGSYYFLMAPPESDVLEAGLGLTCIVNDDLQFVIDVDARFGEDYSAYALSGRAVIEF
jgi:outer membrane autotransporter protein